MLYISHTHWAAMFIYFPTPLENVLGAGSLTATFLTLAASTFAACSDSAFSRSSIN